VNENLHVFLGLFVFFLGNIGLILSGRALRADQVGQMRILTSIMGTVGLLSTLLFFSGNFLGLGMGGMERFTFFPFQIWPFVMGCYFLIALNKSDRPLKPTSFADGSTNSSAQ